MVVTKLMTYSGLIYSEENGMGVNAASMLEDVLQGEYWILYYCY